MNSPLVCPNMHQRLEDIQTQTCAVSPPTDQVKLLRQWIIGFGHHSCMADWEETRKGRSFKLWIITNLHHFHSISCLSDLTQIKVLHSFLKTSCCKALHHKPHSCTSFCCVKMQTHRDHSSPAA